MEMTPSAGVFRQIPQTMLPIAGQQNTMPATPVMNGQPQLGSPQTGFGPTGGFNPMQSLFKTLFAGHGMPNQPGLGGTGDWMQRLMGMFGQQGGPSGSPFGMFGGMFGPRGQM